MTIIYLQNVNKFNELIEFEVEARSIREVEKKDSLFPTVGKYTKERGAYFILYKFEDRLYLYLSGNVYCLIEERYCSTFERMDKENEFTLFDSSNILFKIRYPSLRYDPVNMIDPNFDDLHEELQDFFLDLHVLILDKERQKRIFS